MNLSDALGGDAIHVVHRVEVVILRRNVNVIHVEQDPTVGRIHYFVQKLPLCHFRIVVLRVAADILHSHGDFKIVLHHAHALGGNADGLECVR